MQAVRTWLLIVAFMVAGCQSGTPAPASPSSIERASPTAPRIALVPWSAATPLPTPAPTPPSPPPGMHRCSASQVIARFDGWTAFDRHGQEGSLWALVSLGARGTERCWLQGLPSAYFVDRSGARLPTSTPPITYEPGSGPAWYQIVVLDPGHELGPATGSNTSDGWFWVSWSNWCGGRVSPAALVVRSLAIGEELRISVPGTRALDGSTLALPHCEDRASPSALQLGNVEGLSTTPLAPWVPPTELDVEVDRPLVARAGETLRYGVILVNRSANEIRISPPCPAYEQTVMTGLPGRKGILNCAGLAPLPPGARLAFEMLFDVPADTRPGEHVLIWGFAPDSGYGGGDKFRLDITPP